MRQVEKLGRTTRNVAVGAVWAIALGLVLGGGGCGGDDDPPPNNQCLAKFEVSAETCNSMEELLNCGRRQWSPPNNCNLSRCDCATSLSCNYKFTSITENDCSGIWFTFACNLQTWTPDPGVDTGTCDLVQCLCFTPPPTPTQTRTPTPLPG